MPGVAPSVGRSPCRRRPSVRCRGGCPPEGSGGGRRDSTLSRHVRAGRVARPPCTLPPTPPASAATPAPVITAGPAPAYRCTYNVNTEAFTGAHGTASAIGWLGDHNSVITCLGGTFVVQDGPGNLFQNDGFGVYDGQRTTWADADGYLPAQVTTFAEGGATVSITEFADRVVLGGNAFVAVYSRVHVANPTAHSVSVDPAPSPTLVPLDTAPDTVPPHEAVNHDYVVVADRFGSDAPWPSATALAAAGGFTRHFAHMRAFWNAQLAGIARISVPDPSLVDAYKSGFITTQLTRSGNALDTVSTGTRASSATTSSGSSPTSSHRAPSPEPTRSSPRPATSSAPKGSTSTACGPTPCPGPCTS